MQAVSIGILLWIGCCISAAAAGSQQQTFTISGYGAIIEGDRASARTRAITDAYQRAVEQAAGTLLETRTLIENELMVHNELRARANGYIKKYEIISEGSAGGQYRVTMKATVSKESLKQDLAHLGLLQVAMDGPRIMVLYDPSEARVPLTGDLAEQELLRHFTQKGFNVVDPGTARHLHKEAAMLPQLESTDNIATRLALGHNAEVVLIYRLTPIHTGTDGVFEQGRSTISARAIVTTTAQLLGTTTETATGAGETPELAVIDATKRASAGVADSLSGRIATWWTSFVKNGIPYTVVLESNPRKRLEPRFTNRLAGLTGIVSLNLLACGGDYCEYHVLYRGTMARLRQALLKAMARESGFEHLVTKSIRGNNLVFSVR